MGAFLSGISFLAKLRAGMFNQAHRGGPGRLLTIAGIGLLMIGLVFGVSMLRYQGPPFRRTRRNASWSR